MPSTDQLAAHPQPLPPLDAGPPALLPIPGYRDKVSFDQIVWIQAEGNYCHIHLVDGKAVVVCQTLRFMHALLPNLVRIHKSRAINLAYLLKVVRNLGPYSHTAVLRGGIRIGVSRRQVSQLKKQLAPSSPSSQ